MIVPRSAAVFFLVFAIVGTTDAAEVVKKFPGSATGEVKFRPDRAKAVADATGEARYALERSCKNLADSMHGRHSRISNVTVVNVSASSSSVGWDATVMLSDTCMFDK